MANQRSLPNARNPQLQEDNAPMYETLVERRCLGQTELKVKPGQVGTTNATKPDNLGTLDYAHLRVPLPRDLSNSGIFVRQANRKWPEAYFLMRRSSDGFVSATGMFKAAFPWAQQEEEAAEKDFIKSLDQTSNEEVAGNVWIHPDQALLLADEYGIRRWIEALLDPEAITHGTSDPKKQIKSPPPYRTLAPAPSSDDIPNGTAGGGKTPAKKGRKSTATTVTAAADASPAASPTKKTPARKIATPRKPRKSRGKSAEPEAAAAAAAAASEALATVVNGDSATAKVEIETESVPALLGEELRATKVNVEMPAGSPALDLPSDASAMLEQAREMVQDAVKIAGGPSSGKGKRKARDIEEDEDGSLSPAGGDSKRARTVALELRKERIKRRALTGIAASLAIGALVPAVMAAFGS